MSSRIYKAEELIALLRNRYADKQRYAVFEQVANGTGFNARSWIDAIVFYLWPSDGLIRAAFEIKVSRQDFLKELTNPSKNEWARKSCNEFWFVAPSDVIKEQELPEGVGWMKPHGDTLAIVRHAQRTQAEMASELVAAIARSIQKEAVRDERVLAQRILAEDKDYQNKKRITAELQAFIVNHGQQYYEINSEGGVGKILSEIVAGGKETRDVKQVRRMLDSFQLRIADLFDEFLSLAYVSMIECDELGKFLVGRYGGVADVATIAEKRAVLAMAKKDRNKHYHAGAERLIGTFDRMRRLKEKRDGR